jgi:hypothetical protein
VIRFAARSTSERRRPNSSPLRMPVLPEPLRFDGHAGGGAALEEPPGAEFAQRQGRVGRQRLQAEAGALGLALQVDGQAACLGLVVALVATFRRFPVASLKLAYQVRRLR